MRSVACLAAILAVAALAVGCEQTFFYGPIVNDGPRLKLDWPTPAPTRALEAAKEGPTIHVQARFISAEPAALKEVGLTTDSPFATLKEGDLMSRLTRLQSAPSATILMAPRLSVLSGRSAWVTVCAERTLVVDCEHKPAPAKSGTAEKSTKGRKGRKVEKEAKGAFVPIKAALPEGTALELAVRAEGDEVVFTELKPRLVGLIAMRQCSATAAVGKDEARVKWEEPLALVGAGRLASPCSVRLKAGECLLVPLAYTIHETTAGVRAIVKGKVQEELTGGEGRRTASSPGKRPCVVVLSAEVTKTKAATRSAE